MAGCRSAMGHWGMEISGHNAPGGGTTIEPTPLRRHTLTRHILSRGTAMSTTTPLTSTATSDNLDSQTNTFAVGPPRLKNNSNAGCRCNVHSLKPPLQRDLRSFQTERLVATRSQSARLKPHCKGNVAKGNVDFQRIVHKDTEIIW